MGIKIAHLSDLHFSEKNKNELFSKIDPLITQIENLGNKNEDLVILVSGDIAYSGQKEEYIEAARFFKKLRGDASKFFKKAYIYFVPGNHDCNFRPSEYMSERQEIIDNLVKNNTIPSNENIRYISKPLSNYFYFTSKVSSYVYKKSLLHHSQSIEFGDSILSINLINTAWMSVKHENKSLMMPMEYFDFSNKTVDMSKKIYNLFIYHHPRSWFTSDDDHLFRRIVESDNGLVFTGHEHTEDTHMKNTFKNTLYYSVAGTFEGAMSTFKIVSILDNSKIEDRTYIWSESNRMYICEGSKYVDHFLVADNSLTKPTLEYSEFLQDLGMIVVHQKRKNLVLSDLFVNPYLLMKINKASSQEIRIKDSDVLSSLINEKKCIVDGDYGSGKTTLSKALITELINDRKTAVYLDLAETKGALSTKIRFENYIEGILKEQFGKEVIKIFDSLPKRDRVVIVDNYNFSYESEQNIELLHDHLSEKFGKMYLFTNGKSIISGQLKIDKYLIDFNHYSIENFGPKLQSKLVEKWNILDKDLTEEERKQKNKDDISIIKNLIDNNNLPNTPEVLLTVLSTIQVNHPKQTSIYGHLLNHLISIAMEKSNIPRTDHDETFRVLSVFAYQLYITENRWLEKSVFSKIIESDNNKYDLDVSSDKISEKLTNANVLQKDKKIIDRRSVLNENFKFAFRYNYLYSYFVAKYFSENLAEHEVREEIRTLLDNINVEDNSRILINIWYFSNSDILLSMLDEKINNTLSDFNLFEFENPPTIVKEISKRKENIMMNLKEIDDKKVESNKKELLEIEEIRSQERKIDSQSYNEKEKEEVSEIVILNTVFNLLGTLSQIMKCYGGTIPSEQKRYLLDKCYELGMKSLLYVLDSLQEDEFIDYMISVKNSSIKNTKEEITFEQAYDIAIKYVTFIIQIISLGTVLNISESIANDKFSRTFKAYANDNKSIGIRLVEVAVNYLHFGIEKPTLVEKLIQDTESNFLASSILRIIIWRYYYYNSPKNRGEKARLLSLLNIKDNSTLNIQNHQ